MCFPQVFELATLLRGHGGNDIALLLVCLPDVEASCYRIEVRLISHVELNNYLFGIGLGRARWVDGACLSGRRL